MRGAYSVLACAVVACAEDGVHWREITFPATAVDADSLTVASLPPRARTGCAGVVLAERGPSVFAAWWEGRQDRSATLLVARSPDGGRSWEEPVLADGRDRSDRGCDRIAPSLFADTTTEYLHLSYYLEPADGGAVYFTHSMHASALSATGSGMFHSPVPVVFGGRPVASSVAGRGDTVLVAFEDPNGKARRVAASLSTGSGHIFEGYVILSPASSLAHSPRAFVEGDSLVVQWQERGRLGGTTERLAERRTAMPRSEGQ